MRTITITIEDRSCGYDVHEDGKCCNGLSWDEMLGQVAMLTMPSRLIGKGFQMRTPEEWAERNKALFPNIEQETEVPAIVFYPSGSLGEECREEGRPA